MTFAPALFDHGVRMEHNTHLIQLAKTPKAKINPAEGAARGLPDGALVQVRSQEGSIKVKMIWDKQVANGTIVLPLGFKEVPVQELAKTLTNGLPVEVIIG